MALTPYPHATGKDPQYDLWKARYDYEKKQAGQSRVAKRKAAQEAYRSALRSLNQRSAEGKTAIDNNMLARGVFSSGETSRRQAELATSVLDAKGKALGGFNSTLGQADLDYQNALTSLNLQNQQAIQESLGRNKTGGGSGGGGGGSMPMMPAAPPLAPWTPTLPPPVAPSNPTTGMPGWASWVNGTGTKKPKPVGSGSPRPMRVA